MAPYSIFVLFPIDLRCCFSVSWANRMNCPLLHPQPLAAWGLPHHFPPHSSYSAGSHSTGTQVVGTLLTAIKRILSRANVQDYKA